MEIVKNTFWRLAPADGADPAGIRNDPELTSPDGLVAKLSRRDGIVVASWDSELQVGRVHALGIVREVGKARSAANVDWRPVDFAVSPSAQGRSKWRDMQFFKFDSAVAKRYRLIDSFRDTFVSVQHVAPEAQWEPVAATTAPTQRSARQVGVPTAVIPQPASRPVPQCNRVAPNGEVFATRARGSFMGNRADRLRWLVCELEFERSLKVPRKYTKLFFLDEAVALAAGHRPCRTCRRRRYEAYMAAVRATMAVSGASELDERLNAARKAPSARASLRSLPDGAFISFDANDHRLVWRGALHRWTAEGYVEPISLTDVRADEADVLTPAPSLAALRHGYSADVHASVG